jgi:quercetin dioxygenase-like cupin family protein
MSMIDLAAAAAALPQAWRSQVLGQVAGANFKVLRMDGSAYAAETHDFDEALLVLDGQMNLAFAEQVVVVPAGSVYLVPAGQPHAVAPGSHGTLLIIDRA